ncbi:MAG: NGG1p interacting factor NIF3 [Coxiella sp. RIFCSPHIGHO2_12_FULL_44_14]|nr:MAG: NGG1p interacting factor NIF3 [Coxiella sp. RIFCSPHIGHO2_12_FULL_44_14]
MYKISFYVPTTHLDSVKETLFSAGAGRVGLYDHCAWQTLGTGQFRPLPGSDPTIGQHHVIEQVEEYLVEMVCEDHCLKIVLDTLVKAHPYETPAYAAWKIQTHVE